MDERLIGNYIGSGLAFFNGGKGSGNFGHKGRPGKVGGSGSGLTAAQKKISAEFAKDIAVEAAKLAVAQDKFENALKDSPEYVSSYIETQLVRSRLMEKRKQAFAKAGLDIRQINQDLDEWSAGNGPRDKNGEYVTEPELSKHRDSLEFQFNKRILQDTYREMGLDEIVVYRGSNTEIPPRGFTSYTDSMNRAVTFGDKVKIEHVKTKDVIADDTIFPFSQYPTEREIIVDKK